MDTTSTAGRGIDAGDMNQVLEANHFLHSTIYRIMERERLAHDGDLTEIWYKLYGVLNRLAEVGAAIHEVEALVVNPPKAEGTEKHANLGNMTEAESALYNAITQEGD